MVARDTEPSWVVVGSGSAGRRHAAALRRRDPRASITVVRRPGSHQPTDVLDAIGARTVPTLADAVAAAPTLAVVAGPATAHAEAAVALLAAGADVLVEKPLAADRADGEAIRRSGAAHGRSVVVGYHLRFDEVVAAFRRGVARIGPLVSFELHVGQHLDQWRPGVDPARSVTARQELGGGVLLELSHELDAARWCFGDVAAVGARLRRDGAPTDGRVETVADLDVALASVATGTIHLDMVSEPPRRTWRAVGADGTVVADLLAGTVRGTGGADGLGATVDPGWRDRAEDALIDDLLAVHAGGPGTGATVDDGLAVLDVIAAARTSAATADGGRVPVAAHDTTGVGR